MDIDSLQFESVRLFKEKNKGKRIKNLVFSELYILNIPLDSLGEELREKDFIATLLGLHKVDDGMYVVPFPALRRMLGVTLKKSLALKIEGPRILPGVLTYVLYDGSILYEVSFRLIDYREGKSGLSLSLVIYYAESFLERRKEEKVKKRIETVHMTFTENLRKVLSPYLINLA
ncbi:hypothetical protein [Stygiolobus caldivivus]|uniref:Uncharacterized protein n=1 Tax=Stygiolobus caldivivus TaxID=2824673 RepID=A0A8D5ZKA4_9CREN|nr:hypothetical protein [Stygiolobus caldivivus]BCU71042.1 hypothetical protein KN1_23390 [Stygiolobus caldivivus]